MPVKWYWAHDKAGNFIEFEHAQERLGFNIIHSAVERALAASTKNYHILVNLHECGNGHFRPDLVFLKLDGAGVVDLKHYFGQIGVKFEKRGNTENLYCCDSTGLLFSREHGASYMGEVNQVLGYFFDLKRLIASELKCESTHVRVSFGLCFTGSNADLTSAKQFIADNYTSTKIGTRRFVAFCTPCDLSEVIHNAAFGHDLPPGCMSEDKILNMIRILHCRTRDFNEGWIDINGQVHKISSILVGKFGAKSVPDIQLQGSMISRRHLLITKGENGSVVLADFSKHGTVVNSVLLNHAEITLPLTGPNPIHLKFPDEQELFLKCPLAPQDPGTE